MKKKDLQGLMNNQRMRMTEIPWNIDQMQVVSMKIGTRRMTTMWRHGGLPSKVGVSGRTLTRITYSTLSMSLATQTTTWLHW